MEKRKRDGGRANCTDADYISVSQNVQDDVVVSVSDTLLVSTHSNDLIDNNWRRKRPTQISDTLQRCIFPILRKFSPDTCLTTLLTIFFGFFLYIRWFWCYHLFAFLIKTVFSPQDSALDSIIVFFALWVPFVLCGIVFYWQRLYQSSRTDYVPNPIVPQIVSRVTNYFQNAPKLRKIINMPTFSHWDTKDWLVACLMVAIHINCYVGILWSDHINGKLEKSGILKCSARAFGSNALYTMIFCIALVSRESFFHKLLGISAQKASRYHIWCGNTFVVFASLHSFVYSAVWVHQQELVSKLFPCQNCSAKSQYQTLRNFFGLVALILFLVIATGSRQVIRRRYFRRFVVIHAMNAALILFICLHYRPATFWLAPAGTLYVLYRSISFVRRGNCDVVACKILSNSTMSLILHYNRENGQYKSGQHVYIRVASIQNNWHPFSIASCSLESENETIELTMSVHGYFTMELMRLAKTGMLSSVAVDGFYGSEIEMHPHMIFLAGGTGMVPFLSFLRELEWLVDRKARDNFPESIFIVWTSRDLNLLEQYNALLRKIKSSTLWNIDIHIHCTRRESSKIVHITPFTQTTRSITFPRILISSRYRLMVFSSMSLLSMLAVGIVYTIDFDAWWIKQLVVLLSALGALIAGSLMPFFPNGEVSISPTKGLSTLFMADATRTMEVTYGRPQWPSIMRQIQSQMETYDKDDVLDAYICGPEGFYQDVLSSTPSTLPIRYHVKSFAV